MRVLAALVLPVGCLYLLDRWAGTTPWLTMAGLLICLPVATILVVRLALRDMDAVIAAVAPEPDALAPDAASEIAWNGETPGEGSATEETQREDRQGGLSMTPTVD